jgi:glycopeptide antibiotics resistance protein
MVVLGDPAGASPLEICMPSTSFIVPAMPVLLPLCGVWMVASWLRLRRRAVLTPLRLVTAWVMGWFVMMMLAVTLFPLQVALGDYANRASMLSKANLIPLVTIDARTFLLNILMTVPLGVLLPLVCRVRGVVHLAGLAAGFSASVEVVQFLTDVLVSSGRTADVNDLAANTLGAVAGFLMLRGLCRVAVVDRIATRFRIPHPVGEAVSAHGDPASSGGASAVASAQRRVG